jgi:Xaa-Pro aminopeptidase
MLRFETLTWVPIDRRLIVTALLSPDERDWLNAYHAGVEARLAPRLSGPDLDWLGRMCAPI